jgi:heme-degrading monooxygenase HmoA
MVAVLIEVDVTQVERNAGLTALRERIVPAITSLPGFQSGAWLTGNEDGKGLSLTLWDSEATAQTMVDRFGDGSNPVMSASVVRCEVREVAAAA